MTERRTCPQQYPGCKDCPYIRKHWDRNLGQCPYYLGIEDFTLEQHHRHETISQMFQQLKVKEDRIIAARSM